jgi:hypothetical protein
MLNTRVIMQCLLCCATARYIVLSVIMPNEVMLNVIMMNVVAPKE